MRIKTIFTFFILFVTLGLVYGAQLNSTTYRQNVIVSVGGENLTSETYKIGIAIGIIAKVINSTSYINRLGFFHTWLLADNQPCTLASQCQGGFCCDNLCKSSSCPTPSPGARGGGGAAEGVAGGGGGQIFLCTQDWKCNDWSLCVDESQTRQCELVDVDAFSQATECPSLKNPLTTTQKCKIEFSVSPSSIKEHIKLGTAKTRNVTLRNIGNNALRFNLNVHTINDFVFLSDTTFSVDAGKEKIIELDIIGKKLGSYLGEIEIIADGTKKSIDVIIEVESEQVLFDVKLDILPEYKEIVPGDKLKAQITLLSIGPSRKVDVITAYIIKDKRGNVIDESSETFAVEKQVSFVKSFNTPKTLKLGDYLAIIEVRYENSFAVSSELFRLIEKKSYIKESLTSNEALMTALFVFIIFTSLLLFTIVKKRKFKNKKKFRRF
ncbi:hypothetical protein HYW99_02475 [Candidatus Woesearchaeota archaeon]|nr:hypothetical protein [Candidatus Woesearchaeota archaeon]